MKIFACVCGNRLFFDSTQCTRCGHWLGYDPARASILALEPRDEIWYAVGPSTDGRTFKQCRNQTDHQICNWVVDSGDPSPLCRSCRLNQLIPNLSISSNVVHWRRLEAAKRRLLYTLIGLDLSFENGHPPGLRFEFLEDQRSNPQVDEPHVMTGYRDGLITLNVAEADHVQREAAREHFNEGYRTVLGHLRHESGHFYWPRLVAADRLDRFRALFGDERRDYDEALDCYHRARPHSGWQTAFISAYAQAHPLEDWAESWAHYLHMVDSLETAAANGVIELKDATRDFEACVSAWIELTVILNELNRSMGLRDAYPFVLSELVVEKLSFIHDAIFASPTPSGNSAGP